MAQMIRGFVDEVLSFARIKEFVIRWGGTLFFLYYFYPISFLHSVGTMEVSSNDNVSVKVFNIRNVILFLGLLFCLQSFLNKDVKIKKCFCKVFLCYSGLLTVMFLCSYIAHVSMTIEIVTFFCVFLPSVFFSFFFEEEIFMKANKVLCYGMLIFFCFWLGHGRFFVLDYLGFLTLLLFAIVYTLIKNLKVSFYLLYFLFSVYIFIQFNEKIGGGVGQIFVIFVSVFIFSLYKRYYRKLCFCLCCTLVVLFSNHNFSFFYRVVTYKIAERLELIENKSIENKSIENKSIENKSIENKSIENKSIENKSIENKSMENKIFSRDLFLITPYRASAPGKVDYCYPHNSFVQAYQVFGLLGIGWYLIVNLVSFLGLTRTKHRDFFILMFFALTLLSLKQGSILSSKLLIFFHVFGLKMFFLHKNNNQKTC